MSKTRAAVARSARKVRKAVEASIETAQTPLDAPAIEEPPPPEPAPVLEPQTPHCPICSTLAEPALTIGDVSVCSACGSTVAHWGVHTRVALHADLVELGDGDIARLRHVRAGVVASKARSAHGSR